MVFGGLFSTSFALHIRMFVISNSGSFVLGICRISCLHSHQVLCRGVNTKLETRDCGQWSEGHFHSTRYGYSRTSLHRTSWGQRKVAALGGVAVMGRESVIYHLSLLRGATFFTLNMLLLPINT